MKKLAISADTRNRDLPVSENSTFVNYYAAPSGSDVIQIPHGAGYIEIVSAAQNVWFKLGNEEISAIPSATDVEDGSSPRFIPALSGVLHRVVEETHMSLESSGGVVVSFWRQ